MPFPFFPNKAKEFKSSDCKHAGHFLLVHFQFQRPFQIFRARLHPSLGSSLAFRQQHDVVRVTDKYNSTLLILLVNHSDRCLPAGGKIFLLAADLLLFHDHPFSITPLFKYLLIHWITLSSPHFCAGYSGVSHGSGISISTICYPMDISLALHTLFTF